MKDPCAQIKHADSLANNSLKTNIYSQLIKDTYTGHEYGDEQNLTTWPPNGIIKNTPLVTDYADTSFTPTFTWDSKNGYTINISHDHANGSAPSPADVFQLIIDMNNTNFKLAGSSAKSYYLNNASITVVTTDATYLVMIGDYNTLSSLAAEYNTNPSNFNGTFAQNAADHDLSTEYALLEMFGNSIIVYKADVNSSSFSILTLDGNGNPTVIKCTN